MGLLKDKDRDLVATEFKKTLKDKVTIVVVTGETNCTYCKETLEVCTELSNLAPDHITMINYDIEKDKDIVKKYGINKVPAIKVIGKRENGITFYGIPSGYEFMSLVEAIENVSKDEAKLSKKTKEILSTINKQVHIQVFVTPTCPYCPLSVKLSHNMALESKYIKADMIEVLEFPELGEKYSVEGVPKTVINDKVELEGAYPEDHFIEHLLIATKDE